MTDDELRAAIRGFMKKRGLKPRPWSEKAGLGQAALGAFLRGDTKTVELKTLNKLADAAGVGLVELIGGTRAQPPSTMTLVKWLKLAPQFGGQAIWEDDRERPGMLLPRALIEEHAFGETERVRVAGIRESLDPVVRAGDIAAIDVTRNNPRRESGHYYVWDGHTASVRNLQPLTQDLIRVMAEGGALDVAAKELQAIGRVFWRGGVV